ncbi:ATP-grasp domain-containing protein [Thalassotalea fusca]
MSKYTVGMWMYKNGGGQAIQEELINQLQARDIHVIPDLNLANAVATNGHILCKKVAMEELAAFFSYNAGKQTQYQMYLYQTLNDSIPCLNNFDAFALSEDKFRTSHKLNRAGIRTADYKMLKNRDKKRLKKTLKEWEGRLVYKPTDGWGGMGIVKIENERALDMLFPFLEHTNIPHFYVERFVNYDMTDYRIDIVNGEYIACYGRRAPKDDWKTNITSGGSIMLREPSQAAIDLALKAAKVTGLEIAGVDLIFDIERQEYVVLEVNGIPAFATPEQEKLGLNFNHKKITKIVDLIEQRVQSTASVATAKVVNF